MNDQATAQSRGINVREQINQAFVRSEIGTVADDKALRIYSAAQVDPNLLKLKASSAVDNYLAAIYCCLKAIPSVRDVRSKKLLRDHVNQLLKRLGKMRELVAEADRLAALNGGNPVELGPNDRINLDTDGMDESLNHANFRNELDDEMAAAFDLLGLDGEDEPSPAPIMLPIGSEVEVLDPNSGVWEPGTVAGIDHDTYTIVYADGSDEPNVIASRVRLPVPSLESSTSSDWSTTENQARLEVMSEIMESERQYVFDLNNLNQFYVHVLRNPAHWGGQKEKKETWFSQKTLNDEEAKLVFANIEEIIPMNTKFLQELEALFAEMQTEQSLADVFVEYAPKFKLYVDYVVQFEDSQLLIEQMQRERMGFASAAEAAATQNIPPLKELMQRPLERTKEYIQLLQRLKDRTPSNHPSIPRLERAIQIFGHIDTYVKEAKNMKKNQEILGEIGERFSPQIGLKKPRRFFIFKEKVHRMEHGNPKERVLWLFNDIVICSRPSKFLNRGAYRDLGHLVIKSVSDSSEYGPLAFQIKSVKGETWTLMCETSEMKAVWRKKFSLSNGLIVTDQNTIRADSTFSLKSGSNVSPVTTTPVSSTSFGAGGQSVAAPPPPPPPPPRAIPDGWVELYDETAQKHYYYSQKLNITQWEMPE